MREHRASFKFADKLGVIQKACELLRKETDFFVYYTEEGWFIEINE